MGQYLDGVEKGTMYCKSSTRSLEDDFRAQSNQARANLARHSPSINCVRFAASEN